MHNGTKSKTGWYSVGKEYPADQKGTENRADRAGCIDAA